MRVFNEMIGDYSQTIRIGQKNEVEVYKNGEELFKGEATNIIDRGNTLSFKDMEGKQHQFVKYEQYTFS